MIPPIERYDELDSTNAEARRRAEAGAIGPVWITAAIQTAGRGRRGRAWSTQAGNLAATLLTTTDRLPAEAAQLSFVAALAASDLADTCLGVGVARLKWPNDVLVHGRKAVGILVESGTRPDGRLWLAIGIGVNLAHAPSDVERPATAFAEHMRRRPEHDHPVHGRTATDGGALDHRDREIVGRPESPFRVQPFCHWAIELCEFVAGDELARFENHHALSRFSQARGRDGTAGTGANHDGVGGSGAWSLSP